MAVTLTPARFRLCKTFGHAWDVIDVSLVDVATVTPGRWRHLLALRCTRCTTERLDHVGPSGLVEKRGYRYPDGFRDESKGVRYPQRRIDVITDLASTRRVADRR